MICIQGATALTPSERIDDSVLIVEGSRIASIGGPELATQCPPEGHKLDAQGLYLAPGFIDLQINGGFGWDFTAEPESIWAVAEKLPRYGVTSFLPTIVTARPDVIRRAQAALKNGQPRGAAALGLHLEGPFLNKERKGAHNPEYLRLPSLEAIADWDVEHGVRLVTLAPELAGALEMITALTERGVVVSVGHSIASYEETLEAIDVGVRYGTHLFNAMAPLHHRHPGVVGALLADERVRVGMIVDRVHVHPAVVRLAWQMLGAGRLSLVTDAVSALGQPPGQYPMHEYEVTVDETSVRLPDGALAGSILSMDQALRNLVSITGCDLSEALPTVTTTPAALLGLAEQRGRLESGAIADMVLLTPDLEVVATIASGEIVYRAANDLIAEG